MGKWTDKLYITHSEWSNKFSDGGMNFGGKREGSARGSEKIIPFKFCSLSQLPFETPCYEFICPVSEKPFNESTKIVVNKISCQVYPYQTIDEFNIKSRNMRDLVTDEPFTKSDLIELYNPQNLELRNVQNFYYIQQGINFVPKKKSLSVVQNSDTKNSESSKGYSINPQFINENLPVKKIMDQIDPSILAGSKRKHDDKHNEEVSVSSMNSNSNKKQQYKESIYTSGASASSFTSTSLAPVTANSKILLSDLEYMMPKIKKNAFVQVVTNLGSINLELFSGQLPQTCYNFIAMTKAGYYNNLKFQTNIKNLILVSGDPMSNHHPPKLSTNNPSNKSLKIDNFKLIEDLKPKDVNQRILLERDNASKSNKFNHDKRGLVSLLINTNPTAVNGQFFISYSQQAMQFDGTHSVFGRIVSNLEVLTKVELVDTDPDTFAPTVDVIINEVNIVYDPFSEFTERLNRKLGYLDENSKQGSQTDRTLNRGTGNLRDEKKLSETTNWFGRKL
ncbi:Peptidyl-prolyl cis-trans isomerase-like 2 [Smittium culicis]|uniref:peptidylprolyl isomerase n=1 Tax=Smittium culicis TaxID=133412 RepID=A0A1R1XXZ8_9FUNG|nr:Peptidyl-prolyl cis-trans isomerase-like 2 [Smittium culicis]